MIKDLILKNRSYRRFYQNAEIKKEILLELIELARLTSSGGNLQPLKFLLSNSKKDNEKIFSCLKWAGYLKDWDGPEEGEKPSAYIVVMNDIRINKEADFDVALAVQSVLLGAVEKGFGGCIFGSVDKTKLREIFSIPKEYNIRLVIALGKPREIVKIEDIKDNDVKYWRDEKGVHHVPKRSLKDLIF
ncbi:MAG: nitroreductase family protein [Candidatus Cloacimonetes bacterium]|nr:nitroreductase family protein [Candidatus Cloacimonadota bacterium]